MNEEQKKTYLKDKGMFCPYCESNDLEALSTAFREGEVSQRISCCECGQEWTDFYTLTGLKKEAGK